MKANPRMPIATEGCCGTVGTNNNKITRPCRYMGQRLNYDSNAARCAETNGFGCDFVDYFHNDGHANICEYERQSSDSNVRSNVWTWTVSTEIDRNNDHLNHFEFFSHLT